MNFHFSNTFSVNRIKAFIGILTTLIALGIISCYPEPDFDNSPSISLESVSRKAKQEKIDSVIIVVAFQDGNGDLGLSGSETDPKFSERTPEGEFNKFFHNFFIEIKRKNENGDLEDIVFPDNQGFDGRFPILNRDIDNPSRLGKERALEGNIRYGFELFYDFLGSPIHEGDQLVFEVHIADRDLNTSNEITTPEIVVGE